MTELGTTVRVHVRNGLDVEMGPAPQPTLSAPKLTSTVALLGRDYPQVRFDVLVEAGDPVRTGQPVLRDRHRPDIVIPAPVSGLVDAINHGPRRALVSLCIKQSGSQAPLTLAIPPRPDRPAILDLMLRSGLWAALRTRPFGHIPDPGDSPTALLVTAIDTNPLAPDPAAVIAGHREHFSLGLDTLVKLCEGRPVYLCQRPQTALPVGTTTQVRVAEFVGPHPAGLPGTHIHALCPVGFSGNEVWHLGYQDVIALGQLMGDGVPWNQREISLAGPTVKKPRTLTVPLGAALDELLEGELQEGPVRAISGSVLSGDTALGPTAFLGRQHNQVSVLFAPHDRPREWWRWWAALDPSDHGLSAHPGPLVPTPALDRVTPSGILAVPLLRALLVRDLERARALGALELVEEDLALLSYVCVSKTDYGLLLRDVLEQLHREAR